MHLPYKNVLLVGHSEFISNAIEHLGHESHWPANGEVISLRISGTRGQEKEITVTREEVPTSKRAKNDGEESEGAVAVPDLN